MKDILPQPNLGLVPVAKESKDLTVTPEHLGRCDTLPAAKGSARQMRDMDLFTAGVAAIIERTYELEKTFKALLEEGFAEMRTKLRVIDLNKSSRMQNGMVVDDDAPLDTLYNMRTGQLIPDFPKNLRALDALPGE
ncbi:hypothetical protein E4U13_000412 [Claviceps humidiphila]|uniref:Uncharacterized protein n=1 Tax=Claviceps humidiphila TaxID=1294629 RepID=A0A9P7QCG2_9HYPO|nr:hypothetical protein E4U13_000412 [Claviceps humidiphila]